MGVVRARSGSRLGSYELGERLGAGGMAEVYVGTRLGPHGFNKRFAIKLILPQLAQDSRFVEMFCDEARICAALTHPNIVQVNDFGESDGKLFMAMEFVDGISCAKLLRAVASRGERFPLGAALFIAYEVLRALRFAHEAQDEHGRSLGIVHRDVSPGNILIGRAGEVKLTDFGIVRSCFIDRRTYPGELKGKMGYMSPEQVVGAELDARSDLFTVGIVLAEMLLCRPLFPGRNELDILSRIFEADVRVLERYGSHLSPDLQATLRTALAREPHARFQTAREFAEALRLAARRAGIGLTEGDLAPWLGNLGILARSVSGTREAVSVPLKRRSSRPPPAPASAELPVARPVFPASGMLPVARVVHAETEPPPDSARTVRPPGTLFHVRVGPNNLVGPLSLPQMLEAVATGRVGRETLVSPDGASFRAACEIPAIARLAERRAFNFFRNTASPLAWQKPIDRLLLPALLFQFAQEKETGLLVLRADRQQKRVYFAGGAPSFIASTDRSELLGARLVQAGLVSKPVVEECLAVAYRQGQQRLGETLVARGLLRPTALLRALIEQLEARFVELGAWTSGNLYYYRGEQSGEDHLKSQAAAPFLITRLIREGYAGAEIAELLGFLQGQPITANAQATVAINELGLTHAELRVLECADGLPLEQLVGQLSAAGIALPEEVLRVVFIGLSSGHLVASGWPRDP
jgi:eukaryotic-like serine/threonine-protein kinase